MDWVQAKIFSQIPEMERKSCISFFSLFAHHAHAQPRDVLHFPGVTPNELVIVEEGVLQSFNYTNMGEEFSPFYYTDGDCVFHIALLTGKPVESYCMAVSAVKYVTIPKDAFVQGIDQFPAFQKSVLLYICKTSEELIDHFVIAQMKRPRHKICKYLIELSKLDGEIYTLPFSMEKFAIYLNLARPTLSKELHQMEDDGLIKLSRGKIQIIDIKRLYEALNR